MQFQSDSLVVIALVFFLTAIVPVKLSARVFGASNDSFGAAFVALLVSIPLAYLGQAYLGLGVFGAYLGVALACAVVLRTTMIGALVIPVLACIILVAIVELLSRAGLLGFS